MVDWGALSQPPCYRAAVHNTRAVARCTGHIFSILREAGMQIERSTCVGHSLGEYGVRYILKTTLSHKSIKQPHFNFSMKSGVQFSKGLLLSQSLKTEKLDFDRMT